MRPHQRLISLSVAVLLIVACATTNLVPIGSSTSFVPEEDERELWESGREAEPRVLPGRYRFDDLAVETYLSQLLERLTPASYKQAGGPPIVVRLHKDPRLNAFAMPHGVIALHTGILSRAENEAQIAGLLAHELTHVTHRHAVRQARAIRNREAAVNVAAFLGTIALAAAAVDQDRRGRPETADAILRAGTPLLFVGLQLTKAAAVNGYSRDLEREADEQAVRLMAAAGYPPGELARLFRTLQSDSPNRGSLETFFYGSHPRLSERIETVERLAASVTTSAPRSLSQAEFDRRLVRVRVANATYDAFFGRLALAGSQVDRALGSAPPSIQPVVRPLLEGYVLGAATLGAVRRGHTPQARELLDSAERAYRQTIRAGEARAEASGYVAQAYKSIGVLFHALADTGMVRHCEAKATLEKYLELQPSASDRSDIRAKVSDLRC